MAVPPIATPLVLPRPFHHLGASSNHFLTIVRVERPPAASLSNLEPALALTRARRPEFTGALEHPHHDWALLVRPLLPDGGDVRAGVDGGRELRGCPAVATHHSAAGRHDRVIVWSNGVSSTGVSRCYDKKLRTWPWELDDLGSVGRGKPVVTLVRLASDDVAGDSTVGGRKRREQQGGGKVEPHIDSV